MTARDGVLIVKVTVLLGRRVVWQFRSSTFDRVVSAGPAARRSRQALGNAAGTARAAKSSAFVLDPALFVPARIGRRAGFVLFDALAELRRDVRERGGEWIMLQDDSRSKLARTRRAHRTDALYFYAKRSRFAARARDARVTARPSKSRGVSVNSH